MPGTLFVVATPIGNLEDISARALRVLREASVIAAEDTRRTAHLLTRYGISTPTTSLHEHNETRKADALVARLLAGEHVALVSDAGTPTISDPGQQLIQAAAQAGVRVESIPGPNAAIAALAASGFPSSAFVFMGFPPPKGRERADWFIRAKAIGGTVVFYEAPHRIRRTLTDLLSSSGDCPVVVCRELTKAHEELVRGPISRVLSGDLKELGEFTIVAELGQQQDNSASLELDPAAAAEEIGAMTKSGDVSRRAAIATLAKRHRMRPNDLYAILERQK